jgi:hypothetical protein
MIKWHLSERMSVDPYTIDGDILSGPGHIIDTIKSCTEFFSLLELPALGNPEIESLMNLGFLEECTQADIDSTMPPMSQLASIKPHESLEFQEILFTSNGQYALKSQGLDYDHFCVTLYSDQEVGSDHQALRCNYMRMSYLTWKEIHSAIILKRRTKGTPTESEKSNNKQDDQLSS